MYSTILVPLDGSRRAEAILPHVEQIAARFQATVVLLTIVEPEVKFVSPFDALPDIDLHGMQSQIQESEAYLSRIQRHFQHHEIACRILVAPGRVVDTILATASQEKVSLIAMTSHGRTGLSRVFYGSIAAGVLQQIDRPILLIRSE